MDVKLLKEIVHVVLDGRHLDAEMNRYLLVRQVLFEETNDLALACRQTRLRRARFTIGRKRRQPSHEATRYLRRALQLPAHRTLHHSNEILDRPFPSDVSGNPGFHTAEDVPFKPAYPKGDDRHTRSQPLEIADRGVTLGRRHVENDNVGLQPLDVGRGLPQVGLYAYDRHSALPTQQLSEAFSIQPIFCDDENANHWY